MARIKPDPHVVENRAQCEGALAEMAALDRKLSAIENEMRETVDGAKAKPVSLPDRYRRGARNWRTLWLSLPG